MASGPVIEISALTKRFGSVVAVDDLSFTVEPGLVTGFLGPNGAGKTTTLRSLLGLVRPTSGGGTFDGHAYAELAEPLSMVGTALEAASFHPGRSGRDHLRVVADAAGIAAGRVDEVLDWVGLGPAGRRRVGGYSLGMRQRLGLAGALLGDPGALVLDEPTNGLDPEGIRWMRGFLRDYASRGRTVLVSSHLLAEVQQTVDQVVIIAHGRLVHEGDLATLERAASILVDGPDRAGIARALAPAAVEIREDGLRVTGLTTGEAGARVHAAGLELSLLAPERDGLESVFLELVG